MSLTKQDKQDVQEIVNVSIEKALAKQTEEISAIISDLATQMGNSFAKVDTRIDALELRIVTIEERVTDLEAKVDTRFDQLLNTIDGFLKRLDEVESEQTARDAQMERLLRWAKKVSVKTGIPLNDL